MERHTEDTYALSLAGELAIAIGDYLFGCAFCYLMLDAQFLTFEVLLNKGFQSTDFSRAFIERERPN